MTRRERRCGRSRRAILSDTASACSNHAAPRTPPDENHLPNCSASPPRRLGCLRGNGRRQDRMIPPNLAKLRPSYARSAPRDGDQTCARQPACARAFVLPILWSRLSLCSRYHRHTFERSERRSRLSQEILSSKRLRAHHRYLPANEILKLSWVCLPQKHVSRTCVSTACRVSGGGR